MQATITTPRLTIGTLSTSDHDFILELLNSKGWIEFIGERNIRSKDDAINYINKIQSNLNIDYRLVRLIESETPIGLITFIKRDYLEHHDIGFAFLPAYNGFGYAYEAANAVLQQILQEGTHTHIFATTIPQNDHSIKLLKKLGLAFNSEITVQDELLHLYSAATDALYK